MTLMFRGIRRRIERLNKQIEQLNKEADNLAIERKQILEELERMLRNSYITKEKKHEKVAYS